MDKLAAAGVEGALSGLLQLDPASRAEARALAGKQLALQLEPGPVAMTLCFAEDRVAVLPGWLDDVDATLEVTAAAVARIAAEGAQAMGAGGVTLRGDAALATAVFELLRGLRPDLLGPLGRWLGPETTHVLSESARRARGGLRRGMAQGAALTRERLTGADGLLPGRIEMARFLDEVDELALATDRLEARMRHLRRQIDARTASLPSDDSGSPGQ